jgi:hypothetical protein
VDFKEKLRDYWHDTYYRLFSDDGVEFAMNCKDVTGGIDLGEKPKGFIAVFRFRLHLTLCRACRRYYELSEALGKAIRTAVASKPDPKVLNPLNESLKEKFSNRPS